MMSKCTTYSNSVLVTGANGFVGSHLVAQLLNRGYLVKGLVRRPWGDSLDNVEIITGDLADPLEINDALSTVSTVIHLAARVHQMDESPQMALGEFRNINTRATLNLVEQAAKAGVKRFIYLSTLAVNGTFTAPGQYFTEASDPSPESAYATSKYEAELGLKKIAQQYPIEIVIIRPPMVYGLNAPGNFSRLVSLIKGRIPLPFGLTKHPRSFIYIENLVSFIILCAQHPAAANELFLVSDDSDISLYSLICQISSNLSLKSNVFPVPLSFLKVALIVLGKETMINQLLKPLRVNMVKSRTLLGWKPPYNSSDGLVLSSKNK